MSIEPVAGYKTDDGMFHDTLEAAEDHEIITEIDRLYNGNEFGFEDNDGYACKVDLGEIIGYVNCNTILIEKILQYTKRVKI